METVFGWQEKALSRDDRSILDEGLRCSCGKNDVIQSRFQLLDRNGEGFLIFCQLHSIYSAPQSIGDPHGFNRLFEL